MEEKSDVVKREEAILEFWKAKGIFEKSLAQGDKEFVFYDGPPFGNGLPHYGHLLQSTLKDIIPRFETMRGNTVRRTWGWDCHGLPVEYEAEKILGLNGALDIKEYGIAGFNRTCRENVLSYAHEWRDTIDRMGRWVDMDNDYKTMDASYTESVWWAFKTLYDKGLIYEGKKVVPYSWRLTSVLSNFEANQNYKDVEDPAVTVLLPLLESPKEALAIWTTTPWTLPSNVAVAVHPELTYAKVSLLNALGEVTHVWILEERANAYAGLLGEVVERKLGQELVGVAYTPPFSYFSDARNEGAFQVLAADFVGGEDGTGMVHLSPAFGDEDYKVCVAAGLPVIDPTNEAACFTDAVPLAAGKFVKKADPILTQDLLERHLLLKEERIVHSYPFCYRTDTPLIYKAVSTWFVDVEAIKPALIEANKGIEWIPEHAKEGRFGKWLEGARDWAISRNRFWGAPLPVWKHPTTGEYVVISTKEELAARTQHNNNSFYVIRHGEAESNVRGVISSRADDPVHLTEKGKEQVKTAATSLSTVTKIVASPFVRTRETAEIIREHLGLPQEALVFDERLGEINLGVLHGEEIHAYAATVPWEKRYLEAPAEGECLKDVKRRVGEALYEINERYQNETVLLVTHEIPYWAVESAAQGLGDTEAHKAYMAVSDEYANNAEVRPLMFIPLPHDENYAFDVHRPFIDEYPVYADDGERLTRITEVFDCWFESGSMPFASNRYLGLPKEVFNPETEHGYPANFIAEGLDQTRGWFYTMLVMSVALTGKASFKRVICTGLVLAEDGQKMSKRLKNYPDPQVLLRTHGADAIRLFMVSSPIVEGADLNFSERGVSEVLQKTLGRLLHTLAFVETYCVSCEPEYTDTHILDRWIRARTYELVKTIETSLDSLHIDDGARAIASFVDDLSTWHVRRSRDRLRDGDMDGAKTLRAVLRDVARGIAPYTPFMAEHLYQRLRTDSDPESVHLDVWPHVGGENPELLSAMTETRAVVSRALDARLKHGIKVRQPLATLTVGERALENHELREIVAEEVNVKEVIVNADLGEVVSLDTVITPELKREGQLRDLQRVLQDLRKSAGLQPKQEAVVHVSTELPEDVLAVFTKTSLKPEVAVIEEGTEVLVGDETISIRVL